MMQVDNGASSLAIDANSLNKLKLASKENSPEALKATARQFEALFMNMLLKSMRETVSDDGMTNNEQTKMYTGMLDQQLSQNMADKGLGLADIMVKQLGRHHPALDGEIKPIELAPAAFAPTEKKLRFDNTRSPAAIMMGGANPYASVAIKPEKEAPKEVRAVGNIPASVTRFHDTMASHAERASQATGIPAHFMIGQAALETGWGKDYLKGANGENSHNLFGIKAGKSWTGKTVDSVTTEYIGGVPQKRIEKFRAYDSYADSFMDYAKLIKDSPRYDRAMENLDDAGRFANAIQKSGYATDPNYARKLAGTIRRAEDAQIVAAR